ncbi:MAG TPA: sugar transferase [Mycobacteriales bacterium]|nr:sugar transferase [Mycobacteriales bacterium]
METLARNDRRRASARGRVTGGPLRPRPSPFAVGLVVVDVAAVLGAAALASSWGLFGALYAVVVLLLVAGRPEERIDLGVAHEIPMLVVRGAVALAVAFALSLPNASADAAGLQFGCTLGLLALSRAAYYHGVRIARRRGSFLADTLVIGDGEVALELVDAMQAHPEYGLRLVGLLAPGSARVRTELLLGPVQSLDQVLSRRPVSRIIVAFGRTPDGELVSALRRAVHRDVAVYVVPRFFELGLAGGATGLDHLWGIPLQRLTPPAPRRLTWRLKRLIDVVAASTLLLLLSPVFATVALAVKLSSPGPVLFRQRRVGQGGREFDIIKFRTLRVVSSDAERARVDAEAAHLIQASQRQDVATRQTAVGRILRATSADELPQLWNILRGDMSLVGPRPEVVGYVRVFNDAIRGYGDRHRLPVGLTGWAQVNGLRGETSLAKRVCLDNNYIENWSLWKDVTIIARTFGAVLAQALSSLRVSPPVSRAHSGNAHEPVLVNYAPLHMDSDHQQGPYATGCES